MSSELSRLSASRAAPWAGNATIEADNGMTKGGQMLEIRETGIMTQAISNHLGS